MGLSGAAFGAQEGLDQYLTRKLAAQIQAQHIAEQQAAAQRAAQQDAENAAYRKATLGMQQQQFDAGRQDKAAAAAKATQDAAATDAFIASLPANVRPLVQLHQRGISGVTQHDLETPEAHQAHVTADQQKADDHAIGLRRREKQVDAQFREPRAGADPETVSLRNDLLRLQAEAAQGKIDAGKQAQADASKAVSGGRAEVRDLAQSLLNDPALDGITGSIEGRRDTFFDGKAIDAKRRLDQLVGKLSLESRGKMKGQGQVSDYEGRLLSNAVSAIDRSAGPEIVKQHLREIVDAFSGDVPRNEPTTNTGGGTPKAGGFRVVGVR